MTGMQGRTEQQAYQTRCDNQKRLPGYHKQLRRMQVVPVLAVTKGCSFVLQLPFSRIQWPSAHNAVCLLASLIFVCSAVRSLASKE